MNGFLHHKGYYGSINYSYEDNILYGKIMGIKSVISYEGIDADSLKNDFQTAVEDYLELCQQKNIQPEKPFKGLFQVRTKPELHQLLALLAQEHNTSLNNIVVEALENFVKNQNLQYN